MYEHKTKGTEADETAKQVGAGQAEFEPLDAQAGRRLAQVVL